MQRCGLHHSGLGDHYDGIIADGRAYIKRSKDCSPDWDDETRNLHEKIQIVVNGEAYLPPAWFGLFGYECENNLIQLEVDGKWGYCHVDTGEIVIPPKWDWCGPFYGEYALVRTGCPGKLEWGRELPVDTRCGYINTKGELVIPLEYVDGEYIGREGLFIVKKHDRLFGMVNLQNETVIDFCWHRIEPLYESIWNGFVAAANWREGVDETYTLFSQSGELIIGELDETPEVYDTSNIPGKDADEGYLAIKRNGKYGLVEHGRLLQEPTLLWRELLPILDADWEKNLRHIVIHRGTQQIGGCITEIRTASSRVFIDIGENLPRDGEYARMPYVKGLTDECKEETEKGLLLTHYHGDHIGRLGDVVSGVPIYMGKTAKEIYTNLAKRTAKDLLGLIENIKTFKPLDRIQIGDIAVTPLMVDHSAFDAYMFIVEAGGVRILHTGDFRLHGVRGGKMLKMLSYYAKDIDYIICEGTTVSRTGEPPMTEHELGRKAAELMKSKPHVFVLCASTNIDRIGVFYHANPKGRFFVCDKYQKEQLEIVRDGHKDKSSFYDFSHVYDYAPNLDKHMEEKGFCMLIRQGEFFKRVIEKYKDNCLIIYSMWTGYLDDRARSQGLCDFLALYEYQVLHTSGHASLQDLKQVYDTVKPKRGFIPFHTDAPEKFSEIIPERDLILLNDGEKMLI